MKRIVGVVLALALAPPLAAQTRARGGGGQAPRISLRPFVLATGERLAAKNTFEAAFGQSVEPFWGAGLQLAVRRLFVEVSASRFKKTGQRAFRANGTNFGVGIPLTATITPFEVTGGYRFIRSTSQRLVPYLGAGVGSYGYKEVSDFSESNENVDTRHAGYFGVAGAELRVHRWVRVGADVQFTHITGILGQGGVSKDAGENDLGGIAARVKIMVGR